MAAVARALSARPAAGADTWHGALACAFRREGGGTRLTRRDARMPLALQRPFYPEGAAVCHTLLLHPPGGLAGGDALDIDVDVGARAHVLLSTPAAAKVYRSDGRVARQSVRLRAGAGACIEWLPQESIVFDGARLRQTVHVQLAPDALWLGWDVTRFGRSARGERFARGYWYSAIEVWRGRAPLWIDRVRVDGGGRVLDDTFGLGGSPVLGVFCLVADGIDEALVEAARAVPVPAHGEGGVTRLPHALVCRYRGPSSAAARAWFVGVWDRVRHARLGRPACAPRIWNT